MSWSWGPSCTSQSTLLIAGTSQQCLCRAWGSCTTQYTTEWIGSWRGGGGGGDWEQWLFKGIHTMFDNTREHMMHTALTLLLQAHHSTYSCSTNCPTTTTLIVITTRQQQWNKVHLISQAQATAMLLLCKLVFIYCDSCDSIPDTISLIIMWATPNTWPVGDSGMAGIHSTNDLLG